jgi:hypothetical protein
MALKCPFSKCKTGKLPVSDKNVVKHLIVTMDKDNHFHVHGPISDKALIQDFVINILKEAGIAYSIAPRGREEKTAQDNKTED